jgi:hypothetical protein
MFEDTAANQTRSAPTIPAQIDTRFILAVEFLKSGAIALNGTTTSCAESALELADAVLQGGIKRGWIPAPAQPEAPPPLPDA